MTIKIYGSEKVAGLSDKIKSDNVVAYCVQAKSNKEKNSGLNLEEDKALAQNDHQRDLYYIDSILVSTGWNKNDDVFSPEQVWAARHSPEDKQFNLSHDEKMIIGHITKNTTVTFDGEKIEAENERPEDFEILIASVMYTRWTDKEFRKKIIATIESVEAGEKAVSMEAIFNDFDYAVEKDGETIVIARDEESSFLTQYLRSYGGQGTFDGYKIGRLLKDITFSGVGLVDNPANPRSVIKTSNFQVANLNDVFDQEKNMTEAITEVQAKLDEALASLAEAEKNLASREVLITELKEASASKDTELETVKAELTETKASISLIKRTSTISRLGLSEAEVAEMLEKFASVDDDTFAEIVGIKEEAIKAAKPDFLKKDDDKEDKDDKEDDVDADVDEAVAEADDDLGVDDKETNVLASVTEFFSKAINKVDIEGEK